MAIEDIVARVEAIADDSTRNVLAAVGRHPTAPDVVGRPRGRTRARFRVVGRVALLGIAIVPEAVTMPSHRANKWGTACEYRLAEKYNLELERASWHDAVKNGTPWELKATKRTHADGQPGNFKIYRQYHERLQEAGGRYGFAVYRIRGRGCQVLQTTTIAASRLPTVRWHGGGDHRGTEQAKLAIGDVF